MPFPRPLPLAHRYAQLPAPGSLTATSPIAAAATELGVRFVRLSGLLFDRINLEEFDQVLAGAFASLKVGGVVCVRRCCASPGVRIRRCWMCQRRHWPAQLQLCGG